MTDHAPHHAAEHGAERLTIAMAIQHTVALFDDYRLDHYRHRLAMPMVVVIVIAVVMLVMFIAMAMGRCPIRWIGGHTGSGKE